MAAAAGSVAAAAMAVAAAADTGKFRGFPRKARLLRQAGFSRWVEDEQILVEIRGFPPFRRKEGERVGHGASYRSYRLGVCDCASAASR
jgi:hypothetical protein